MAIVLTPEAEALVRQQVENGRFSNVDDALLAAIELLAAQGRQERLRTLIAEGWEQAEHGELTEVTPEYWDRLQAEADEADLRGDPISSHVCG